jgi:hypothetical protein
MNISAFTSSGNEKMFFSEGKYMKIVVFQGRKMKNCFSKGKYKKTQY